MADTEKPYGSKEWNEEIIQKVNNLCENPDEGCDPLETLEEIEDYHLWKKSDVLDVQNKLIKICPENEFEDLKENQLWSNPELIEPLEEAIENGWCSCQEEETIYDFGIFEVQELNARKNEDAVWTFKLCTLITITQEAPWYPPANNSGPEVAIEEQQTIIRSNYYIYMGACREIFRLEDELENLEKELADLETELLGLKEDLEDAEYALADLENIRDIACSIDPGSGACYSAQDDITTKQQEIDILNEQIEEKQTEIDEKQTEVDEKQIELDEEIEKRNSAREDWDNAAIRLWELLENFELRFPTDIRPFEEFPEIPEKDAIPDPIPTNMLFEPWGDYFEDTRILERPTWTLISSYVEYYGKSWTKGYFSPSGFPYLFANQKRALQGSPIGDLAFVSVTYTTYNNHLEECQDGCFAWIMSCNILPSCLCDCCIVDVLKGWGKTDPRDNVNLTLEVTHAPDYTRPPEPEPEPEPEPHLIIRKNA
jgi:molecular chaperone GrpE (heat shock protein)